MPTPRRPSRTPAPCRRRARGGRGGFALAGPAFAGRVLAGLALVGLLATGLAAPLHLHHHHDSAVPHAHGHAHGGGHAHHHHHHHEHRHPDTSSRAPIPVDRPEPGDPGHSEHDCAFCTLVSALRTAALPPVGPSSFAPEPGTETRADDPVAPEERPIRADARPRAPPVRV